MTDHAYLTVDEAATLLRVDVSTVRRQLAAGLLPGQKVGKEWRLSRAALDAHFNAYQSGDEETARRTAELLAPLLIQAIGRALLDADESPRRR